MPFDARAFAGAILRPGSPPPPGLRASRRPGDAADLERRFAVHRNTVVAGLVDVLAARYPVTQRLLGEAFFRAAAREFALASPPRSRVLLHYGDGLPAFLAGFAPARRAPVAAEIAHLEAAVARAAHAADAEALPLDALAALRPEALDDARLLLHPSAEVVASPLPIVTIHEREGTGSGGPPVDMGRGEDAIVLRPRLDVVVRRLPPGGRAFAEALLAREPLGAAARAGAATPGFDLAANLAALFDGGGVAAVERPPARSHRRKDA